MAYSGARDRFRRSLSQVFVYLTEKGANAACRYLLYWWLILALVLLSAYLILWKPRKLEST